MKLENRQGAVLICVLACSLIAITLAASLVHISLRATRESRQNLRLRQAQWLLTAGVQRARLQIAQRNFSGEDWQLPKSVIDADAMVRIEVRSLNPNSESSQSSDDLSKVPPPGESILVTVSAELGLQGSTEHTIHRTQTFITQRASSELQSTDNINP